MFKFLHPDDYVTLYRQKSCRHTRSEDGNVDVAQVLSETDLDIMKNILRKAWLEDFYAFCMGLGPTDRLPSPKRNVNQHGKHDDCLD